jgi:Fur family ferric uptake transcriptional regulator
MKSCLTCYFSSERNEKETDNAVRTEKVEPQAKFILTNRLHEAIHIENGFQLQGISMADVTQVFLDFLKEKNQHYTTQRALIVDEFVRAKTHLSVEELYLIVKQKEPTIGQVTVFRTLKLLEEAGIANPVNFGDKTVRYELSFETGHHDHLVCIKCGKVIEVLDPKLEQRKEKICKDFDFTPLNHRLEIFGICKACR